MVILFAWLLSDYLTRHLGGLDASPANGTREGRFRPRLFCVVGCGGCGGDPEADPETFHYPVRQDWIVVELPKEAPTKVECPANSEAIRELNNAAASRSIPRPREPCERAERLSGNRSARQVRRSKATAKPSRSRLTRLTPQLGVRQQVVSQTLSGMPRPDGNGRGPTGPWIAASAISGRVCSGVD
jgi:hypothetical protein